MAPAVCSVKNGTERITISDIAAQAGVSKSTVSRYLNERYECMSIETRAKISAVIAATGYRPSAVARSLKKKQTQTIAAIIANILNPFSTAVIRGIEDCCQQAGFNLILCNADDQPAKEQNYLEILSAKQIDGLIINTTGLNNDLLQSVCGQMPIVLIDRRIPELALDTVTLNNQQGVACLVDHLVAKGRRRIALFTMPFADVSPRNERVQGYQDALARHGLVGSTELLIETAATEVLVKERLAALWARDERPDAVLGVNNLMTMALIKAIKALQLSIPDDIAVVGVDDWEWAALLYPPVTVLAQPAYDMGNKAAELLFERINRTAAAVSIPQLVVFNGELIVRQSCG